MMKNVLKSLWKMLPVLMVVLCLSVAGCGGNTVVVKSRTLVHNDGTVILDQVTNIQTVIRIDDDDVTGMDKDAYKEAYADQEVTYRSLLVIDGNEILLASDTIKSHKGLSKAQGNATSRNKDINSFLKSKKMQLDIRSWQK